MQKFFPTGNVGEAYTRTIFTITNKINDIIDATAEKSRVYSRDNSPARQDGRTNQSFERHCKLLKWGKIGR